MLIKILALNIINYLWGISKQLKNINILEIGTHHGNSSVALAYGNLFGNNIKIDTYDISNLLQ